MCRIAIIPYHNGSTPEAWRRPRHASSPRASRGQDAAYVLLRSAVALAHARLSTVDTHGGTQSMQTVDGQLVITYNGELYNF